MPKLSRRLSWFSLLLGSFLICLSVFFPGLTRAQVGTQEWAGICVEKAPGESVATVATIAGFQCLIANFLSIALSLIGLGGFAMMIIAAFRIMLSGGNAKGMEEGRNTLTYAVIGLIVALSAFFIVFLIGQFTGINTLTNFHIIIPNSKY